MDEATVAKVGAQEFQKVINQVAGEIADELMMEDPEYRQMVEQINALPRPLRLLLRAIEWTVGVWITIERFFRRLIRGIKQGLCSHNFGNEAEGLFLVPNKHVAKRPSGIYSVDTIFPQGERKTFFRIYCVGCHKEQLFYKLVAEEND